MGMRNIDLKIGISGAWGKGQEEAVEGIPRQCSDICFLKFGGRFTVVHFIFMLHNSIQVAYSLFCININYMINKMQWNYKIGRVLIISKSHNFITVCLKSSSESARSGPF